MLDGLLNINSNHPPRGKIQKRILSTYKSIFSTDSVSTDIIYMYHTIPPKPQGMINVKQRSGLVEL